VGYHAADFLAGDVILDHDVNQIQQLVRLRANAHHAPNGGIEAGFGLRICLGDGDGASLILPQDIRGCGRRIAKFLL
jgi:hypothetical protein